MTLVSNVAYANGRGIYSDHAGGNLCIDGRLGYDGNSVASPDALPEVAFTNTQASNLVLRNSQVNPSADVDASGFAQAGSYLASFNQNHGRARFGSMGTIP